MFKVQIDSDAFELAEALRHFNIDVLRYLNMYMSKVYSDLREQHSRKYTYVTPPASKRNFVYRRSGQLLQDLKESVYVEQTGPNSWEAGFDIKPSSYLSVHVGNEGDPPVRIRATGSSSLFQGRMAIPLRAALNSDGTPKVLSPRVIGQLLILPAKTLLTGRFERRNRKGTSTMNNKKLLAAFASGKLRADFSGEDTKKFNDYSLIVCKVSGRKLIPMFVLANEVRIPKRIFPQQSMDKYYDSLYNGLQEAVEFSLMTEGY